MIVKIAKSGKKDNVARLVDYVTQLAKQSGVEYDSVAQLTQYVTRDDHPATAHNCGVEQNDIKTALAVMQATQSLNTRAERKTYHVIVSFPPGENPPAETLQDIGQELMESVGLGEHQRICAVHTDTECLHMHLVVNLIHPLTNRSVQPKWDWTKLSEKAAELEVKHNLERCEGRGTLGERRSEALESELRERKEEIEKVVLASQSWQELQGRLQDMGIEIYSHYNGIVLKEAGKEGYAKGSSLDANTSKAELEGRLGAVDRNVVGRLASAKLDHSAAAQSIERHRGIQSFQSWILDKRVELRRVFDRSSSWDEIFEGLSEYGLGVMRYRRGMVLANLQGKGTAKVSLLGRDITGDELASQFGEIPAGIYDRYLEHGRTTTKGYQERSLESGRKSLFEEYKWERFIALESSIARNKELAESRAAGHEQLNKELKEEFQSLRGKFYLGATGKRLAFKELKKKARKIRSQLQAGEWEEAPAKSYRTWLVERAREGNEDALEELRAISTKLGERRPWEQLIAGAVSGPVSKSVRAVAGAKVYRDGTQELRVGDIPLLDDGRRIHVLGSSTEEVRAMLLASKEKFGGPLDIQGSESFVNTVLIAALDLDEIWFKDQSLMNQLVDLRKKAGVDVSPGLHQSQVQAPASLER